MGKTAQKALLSLVVVGALGAAATVGAYSAFSSTTVNSGNSFAAGTVYVADNDANAAMYTVSNKKPGDTSVSCIKVTYTGTLAADVKLYTTSTIGSLGQYINLTVEKGTSSGSPTFPACGTYTSEATVFSGTLASFATAHSSYATGASSYPASQTSWGTNDSSVYRFTLTLQDDNNANGANSGAMTSGTHSFTWEARNQ